MEGRVKKMYPDKLKKGDVVRIVAPSKSLSIIEENTIKLAEKRLNDMGLIVTYGKNVMSARKYYDSAPISQRIEDLHDAFSDEKVRAILSVVGGYNSNQLLKSLDYHLIANNPKIFCGLSDITALQNAIFAKTGLVTYSGPHFSNFGMVHGFEYTLQYFRKMLFEDEDCFEIESSDEYSSDVWYLCQENRSFNKNEGMIPINEGSADGIIVGGNLCTLNLLQGTEYMPDLKDKILFVEDCNNLNADFFCEFDRNLESLSQTPFFNSIKGLVIGRAEDSSNMDMDKWKSLLDKDFLQNIPIVLNANIGHTTPIITFPIGGRCRIQIKDGNCHIYLWNK